MPEDTPRPAPAAIRTALGAIFVSLELSRRTWLIRAARAVPRTPRQLPAFRYRVLEFGPTEIFPPVGAMHCSIPVSADHAAPAGPAHPREMPASRRGSAKSRETQTCMGVFLSSGFLFVAGSLFGAERPFLVPSPAIRFAERAERCQGSEMLAQLSGLPLSVACVFAAPPVQARGRL